MTSREPFRCWAEVELDALRHNCRVARARSGNARVLAVIKANGYGHGLSEVAKALSSEVALFGVANLQEAIEARDAVPRFPVLILGPALPAERGAIVEHGFIASISSFEEAAAFDRTANNETAQVNLAVDTGMGRMGCAETEAVATLQKIAKLRRVRVQSVSTHLPSADEDAAYTHAQLSRFRHLAEELRAAAPREFEAHALPSAGVLSFGDHSFDLIRPGLLLYGISPVAELQSLLRPALTLKSRVVLIRELAAGASISYGRSFSAPRPMRVATISAGYADGLPRSLSNRDASVLIAGRRCSVLGRVTMDMTVVDLANAPGAAVGDEVVLIGRQGEEEILATEIAARAGTIAWEIFTGIGTRVRRVYV